MGNCFLHGNGGDPLNYRVVIHATKDELLKTKAFEKTIGVVTDYKYTGHIFSPLEPENPGDGIIWFPTKNASSMGFNALVENSVMLYPVSCKQNIEGEWVQKDVYTSLGMVWVPWTEYLWNCGDTGKYTWRSDAVPQAETGEGMTLSVGTTYADGSVRYKQEANKGGVFYCENVDLTNYYSLVFEGSMTGSSNDNDHRCAIYVWNERPSGSYKDKIAVYKGTFDTMQPGPIRLGVRDLKGKYCVGFGLYGDEATFTLKSLRLEADGL